MTKMTQLLEFFERYNWLKTLILIVVLTVLLQYFLWWPGSLLAAAIGGFFIRRFGRAALIGFLGGLIAWGFMIGANLAIGAYSSLALFARIAGMSSIGGVLLVVIILIGGLLGLAGSLLGNAVFTLVEPQILPSKATTRAHPPPKKETPKKSTR